MYNYDKMAGYAVGDRVIVHPRDRKNCKVGVIVKVDYNFGDGLFEVDVDGRVYLYRTTSLKHYSIDKFDKKYGKI